MADLSFVDAVPALARDRRITLGGGMAQIRTEFVVLNNKFSIAQALKSTPAGASIKIAGGAPVSLRRRSFRHAGHLSGIARLRIYRNSPLKHPSSMQALRDHMSLSATL
jgi:hypothetical protein